MKRLIYILALMLALGPMSYALPPEEVYAYNVDGANTDLRQIREVPPSGGPKYPAVVLVHGHRWKAGDPGPQNVQHQLALAGYLVFSIEYRLSPTHLEMNAPKSPGNPQQDPPSNGRHPQGINDVGLAIRTARTDGQCDGRVAVVSLSSGGHLASWWSIAGTDGLDKPDALVVLSGLYNLDSFDILHSGARPDIENYLGHTTDEGAAFDVAAKAASPFWLTVTGRPCPVLLFNSDSEIIPVSQLTCMVGKYSFAGGILEDHIASGNAHGADLWNRPYGGAFSSVGAASIDFLHRMVPTNPTINDPYGIIHVKWAPLPKPFPPPIVVQESYGTGVSAAGNTTLKWKLLIHGDVPRPMVGVIHGGEFRELPPGPLFVAQDLYYAGFNVFVPAYRLADPGNEMHPPRGDQPLDDHGIFPEQTDDLSQAIIAARNGTTAGTAGQVNGKVAAVGGSAGATHAAWFAAGSYLGGDKLDCAVLLSGAYEFADPASWPVWCGNDVKQIFINYVGCVDGDPSCQDSGGALDLASPYRRFGVTSSPVYALSTNEDHMPPNQYYLFVSTLTAAGSSFLNRLITEPPSGGSSTCTRHSFDFWFPRPGLPQECSPDSIAFIKTYCPVP